MAKDTGELKGVVVKRRRTSISHLLFADNCILFGIAQLDEWKKDAKNI